MGVVSRRWMWVESMGVVVRRYIDFLSLLLLYMFFFAAASLLINLFFSSGFFSFLFRYFLVIKF